MSARTSKQIAKLKAIEPLFPLEGKTEKEKAAFWEGAFAATRLLLSDFSMCGRIMTQASYHVGLSRTFSALTPPRRPKLYKAD